MVFEQWVAFAIASIIISLAPGPDNIFVLMQSVIYGRTAGFKIISGLCSGLLIHTFLVTIGVSALIRASPSAFLILKIAGAAYLVYLAVLAWKAPAASLEEKTGVTKKPMTFWTWWRRGFIMNLTNPKVIVFFLAFFPQFVSDKYSYPLQMIIMGITFIGATVLVFGACAIFAEMVRRKVSSPEVQRWINRTGATIFVLLAANLVFAVE
ncbi:MAG: LysE family translocator [Burkholderiales bacterium]|nr:LysE family translocator [Burkholderiales bacterium]